MQLWRWSDSGEDPHCLHSLPYRADINCLEYVSLDLFAVASSAVDVTLHRHVADRLEPGRRWDRLHHTKCGASPCCWLSDFGLTLAWWSTGELGVKL